MKYKNKFLLSLVVLLSADCMKGNLENNHIARDLMEQLSKTQAMNAMKAHQETIDSILFINQGDYYLIQDGHMYKVDDSLKSSIYADATVAKISDEVKAKITAGAVVNSDKEVIDSVFEFVNKKSTDAKMNLSNLMNTLLEDGLSSEDDLFVRVISGSELSNSDANASIDSLNDIDEEHKSELKTSVLVSGNIDYKNKHEALISAQKELAQFAEDNSVALKTAMNKAEAAKEELIENASKISATSHEIKLAKLYAEQLNIMKTYKEKIESDQRKLNSKENSVLELKSGSEREAEEFNQIMRNAVEAVSMIKAMHNELDFWKTNVGGSGSDNQTARMTSFYNKLNAMTNLIEVSGIVYAKNNSGELNSYDQYKTMIEDQDFISKMSSLSIEGDSNPISKAIYNLLQMTNSLIKYHAAFNRSQSLEFSDSIIELSRDYYRTNSNGDKEIEIGTFEYIGIMRDAQNKDYTSQENDAELIDHVEKAIKVGVSYEELLPSDALVKVDAAYRHILDSDNTAKEIELDAKLIEQLMFDANQVVVIIDNAEVIIDYSDLMITNDEKEEFSYFQYSYESDDEKVELDEKIRAILIKKLKEHALRSTEIMKIEAKESWVSMNDTMGTLNQAINNNLEKSQDDDGKYTNIAMYYIAELSGFDGSNYEELNNAVKDHLTSLGYDGINKPQDIGIRWNFILGDLYNEDLLNVYKNAVNVKKALAALKIEKEKEEPSAELKQDIEGKKIEAEKYSNALHDFVYTPEPGNGNDLNIPEILWSGEGAASSSVSISSGNRTRAGSARSIFDEYVGYGRFQEGIDNSLKTLTNPFAGAAYSAEKTVHTNSLDALNAAITELEAKFNEINIDSDAYKFELEKSAELHAEIDVLNVEVSAKYQDQEDKVAGLQSELDAIREQIKNA
ncbi:hypothetical protein FZC35_01125 [Candidatus Cytomitobacter indipagum]|uniref:Uncharacterized protein n=1 Tax=Candidatus Cytomitobacter indipagum TaxID=2601575 RepID=A0A5C0UE70_9PROT|nr:hypothetical protein [Candidatus Cytomitobacter indipagum]QEK37981.1 hypothetical protein FZC35_01125 [Candidatus Cytomitobacter indipagum]